MPIPGYNALDRVQPTKPWVIVITHYLVVKSTL